MAYVTFNKQNISEGYALTEQEGDGWYKIPEEHEAASHFRLVDGKVIPLSEDELKEYRFNIFKSGHLQNIKRGVSQALTETDWLIQRHIEQVEFDGETSLTNDEYQSLLKYRSDLRSLSNEDLDLKTYTIPEFPLKDRYSFYWIDDLENLHKAIPQELL